MRRHRLPIALALAVLALPLAPGRAQQRDPDEPRATPPQRPRSREDLIAMFRRHEEVDVQEVVDSLPTTEEIRKRQLEIADRMMGLVAVEFIEPPSPTAERGAMAAPINDYLKWSLRHVEARSALAGSDDERRQVVAEEVAKLRRVEDFLRQMARGLGDTSPRRLTPQMFAELEYQRLAMEARLRSLADGKSPE